MSRVLFVFALLMLWCLCTEATYRKPPFNGSIFGKRSSSPTRAQTVDPEDLSTACELAASLIPVCSNWLNRLTEMASSKR